MAFLLLIHRFTEYFLPRSDKIFSQKRKCRRKKDKSMAEMKNEEAEQQQQQQQDAHAMPAKRKPDLTSVDEYKYDNDDSNKKQRLESFADNKSSSVAEEKKINDEDEEDDEEDDYEDDEDEDDDENEDEDEEDKDCGGLVEME